MHFYGMQVAVCIKQPDVGRGAMTAAQLETVHAAIKEGRVSPLCYRPARSNCP
jgi:hypothetical protein